MDCCPWGCTESDTTEATGMHACLEKEMATHSSILPWRILGTEEPGGLLSMGSQRVRHDCSDLASAAAGTQFVILLCVCVCVVAHSVLSDFCDPWTVALQVS